MSKYDFTAAIPTKLKTKIPLLPVKDVEPSKLQPNPKNTEIFRTESPEYFERLTEDIRKRGIIVPLIAEQNGTILAGHNRWEIAKRLHLKFVPVQYVASELSEEEAREFVIKDNLLRRQFSSQEWLEIYKQLYPNFDERLAKHGQRATAKTIRVDNVHSEENGNDILTAERIAADTGQSKAAVLKQLQRKKREKEAENTSQTLMEQSRNIDTTLLKKVERSLQSVKDANEPTRKAIAKVLKAFAKQLS
ncbi:MAG: ParB N-terminal domain-containing protein [Candidatus Kapabacteria bacterium]|nr:ParB N-terminal domain-containing protein [Candidatus Kapabacteria bacterium]